jgi:hypothetical protein
VRQPTLFDLPASPFPPTPAEQRDAVLADLEAKRRAFVETAQRVAHELYEKRGGVTSPEVLDAMRMRHPDLLRGVDPRTMGAVLLPSKGWVRTDEIRRTGSKARPVPVWVRHDS